MKGALFSSVQAATPEDATHFETIAEATKMADQLIPSNRKWKVDAALHGGETRCVVKHWPRHKTELCAERRWLKVATKKKGKKKHDEGNDE